MYVSVCGYMLMSGSASGGQSRVLDPLDLESQVIVTHLTSVLETKPGPLEEQQALHH